MNPFYFAAALLCIAWPGLSPAAERSPAAGSLTRAEDENWAFEPAHDDFNAESFLDLRYLNENIIRSFYAPTELLLVLFISFGLTIVHITAWIIHNVWAARHLLRSPAAFG